MGNCRGQPRADESTEAARDGARESTPAAAGGGRPRERACFARLPPRAAASEQASGDAASTCA
eukprot:9460466-Alexandrium_andersonii.AAC.1